ncbi:hypothetical protein K501DRAFT_324745 [Backusella circina FSU 941]|nr:hypothetical protein K501DRAFT_324745 [Backusella circina FSU 941]
MQPTFTLRAAHKPLIRFLGPRVNLWKDAPHHVGPHAMTPPNLVKHVATATEAAAPKPAAAAPKAAASQPSHFEFGQLPPRYRRAPLTDAEMEAIESGGATYII